MAELVAAVHKDALLLTMDPEELHEQEVTFCVALSVTQWPQNSLTPSLCIDTYQGSHAAAH